MTFYENQAPWTVGLAGACYRSDIRKIKLVKVADPEILPSFHSDYG